MADESGVHELAPDRSPQHPEDVDLGQIVERLSWTPRERFRYFLDLVEFWEQARTARRLARHG